MNPLVSFVIPAFNEEKYIGRCLRSIRNQMLLESDYEVLIIDNGSTDCTHRIIRDLGFDFRVIPRIHVSALRNRGAAMARGHYLAFVDSDVELLPQWAENGLAVFSDQTVVASGCFPGIPSEATWVERVWDAQQCGSFKGTQPTPVPWLPSANLIVRRPDFLSIGGFNTHLQTAEDVDLGYRLGQRGMLLHNPPMKAIHWGGDRDLSTFWRKEVWRGMGSLPGVLSHGLRWDELPSLGYPLWIIGFVLLVCLGVLTDLSRAQIRFAPLALVLLVLPALLLAVNTGRSAKCPASIPQLFLLYLIYGFARATAVIRSCARVPMSRIPGRSKREDKPRKS